MVRRVYRVTYDDTIRMTVAANVAEALEKTKMEHLNPKRVVVQLVTELEERP